MNEEMVEATVRVPKEMWKAVGRDAVDSECSKAEVVLRAIDGYLYRNVKFEEEN